MLIATANISAAAEQPRERPTTEASQPAQPAVRPEARLSPEAPASDQPSRISQSSRSRLTYDQELSRVFVEIVDPKSGEVVKRFPPEELVKHIDSLIEANRAKGDPENAGLVFDQVV
jgi:uncharacterized FlaG/YvyC family protein